MTRDEVLIAAIATDRRNIAVYEAKPPATRTADDWEDIATNRATLDKNLLELAGRQVLAPNPAAAPLPAPPSDALLAEGADGALVYLAGGTPAGNPNGPDWTGDEAEQWFRYVWTHAVGYHHVRATLLPGSHVLSIDGYTFAKLFEMQPGLVEAPEDFNPLGLAIVP